MEDHKKIELNLTLKQFFRQYLEVLSPLHNITPREKDLLAQLLYYNFIWSDYPDKLRNKAIFDYDTKLQIKEELGMSTHNFLNIIKSLRKKGVIKDDSINKSYQVFPSSSFSMIYKFNITDDIQMHKQ